MRDKRVVLSRRFDLARDLCFSLEPLSRYARMSVWLYVHRLGDMLRSRSQWAQADAAGCLGWLIGHIQGTALHELLPLMTQLMVKHTTADDELFLREERQRKDRRSLERNRSGKVGGGYANGGAVESTTDLEQDNQARERMDNIRVYTLIFLLKVMFRVESSPSWENAQTGGSG